MDISPNSSKITELKQNLKVHKGTQSSLRQHILYIQTLEMEEIAGRNPPDKFNKEEYENYAISRSDQILFNGKTRTTFPLREWLEVSGIESDDLLEQFCPTNTNYLKLFSAVDYYLEESYIKDEEVDLLVNTLLIISALAEEYKKTKVKYFSEHSEEWEYLLQEKEKNWKLVLQQKEVGWKEKEIKFKHHQQRVEEELNRFKNEQKELEWLKLQLED
ncbi:hypothetical protein ACFYKT_18160 [Cytobacillus sp. FJAT-53684]|uniref:Uncharacterized protein n=1 Tax=Cytobacillus mangrovibacter TaxID=3299024 RepID=A0ABW6K5M2_9BACI